MASLPLVRIGNHSVKNRSREWKKQEVCGKNPQQTTYMECKLLAFRLADDALSSSASICNGLIKVPQGFC